MWWTKYVLLHAIRTNATTTGVRGDNSANTENKQTEEAHQNLWVINYTGVMYQTEGMKHANYTYTLKLRGKS